jgi:thymidylate synthase
MDRQWQEMMDEVLKFGEPRNDRTGKGTRALFGLHTRFDLRAGFPATTVKRLAFGQVAGELAAFVRGAESLKEFQDLGVKIWDANAKSEYWLPHARYPGDVGRIYGAQWRRWRSVAPGRFEEIVGDHVEIRTAEMPWVQVDQLETLVHGLKEKPHDRRHLVTSWNPGELKMMCLPPCHVMMQFYCADAGGKWLDLQFHMRSLDLFLGMPFDVASYALLCHLVGREVGRMPRFLTMTVGDAHVYNNHAEQARECIARTPCKLPRLALDDGARLWDFRPEQARLEGYVHLGEVKAEMNV